MVELRWLSRQVETLLFSNPALFGEKGRKDFRTELVLQYRTAANWRVFSDVVSIDMRDHSIATIIDWSDWQDVPTVKDIDEARG